MLASIPSPHGHPILSEQREAREARGARLKEESAEIESTTTKQLCDQKKGFHRVTPFTLGLIERPLVAR